MPLTLEQIREEQVEAERQEWGILAVKTVDLTAQAYFIPGLDGTVLETEGRRYRIQSKAFKDAAIKCLQHVGRVDLFAAHALCDVHLIFSVNPNADDEVTTKAVTVTAIRGEGHLTIDLKGCAGCETLFAELSEDLADEARRLAE